MFTNTGRGYLQSRDDNHGTRISTITGRAIERLNNHGTRMSTITGRGSWESWPANRSFYYRELEVLHDRPGDRLADDFVDWQGFLGA